jgi:DNA-binding NtrC family response regulator
MEAAMQANRKVLVVDDEPVVLQSCRRVLAEEGYDVETAAAGREGMRLALARNFDLVLTDLRMPDLDGMCLVRTLRQERPQTAVVIITGYGTVTSAVEALKLGVSDYLEKPFAPEEVAKAARDALAAGARPRPQIQAELVREVLAKASRDDGFGRSLLERGSRVLTGVAISPEAKAAIVSGDLAWIERECGELSAEERGWLDRRLGAES